MKTSLFPLQAAIYNRLANDVELSKRITGVFDEVPSKQPFPYVTLGEDFVTDYSTKTWHGEEITHTLHVWSRYKGRKEVKEILNLVLESLTSAPLSLEGGFSLDLARREYMDVITDMDGVTKHGVLRMRFKISQ